MKKNVIAFIVMVAMLTATFLTGCDTKDMNTDTATIDQVVATADETSPTEDATDTETEAQTEAPTEKSTETDKKKSDKDAEDNEDENENEDSGTGSASNTSNNSSSGSNTTTTNKKPNSNNSSSNSTKPNNNSGSNSSNNKPSNNSGSNNNSNSKPNTNNNNNNNSGNTNTKPAPAPVITDDTPLSHDQLCTDANMQKVTSAINDYFINLGMIYNPSLNKDNCGWFYDCTYSTDDGSVNEYISREIQGFESEANAFLNMYDSVYSDLTFYCYAERRSDGEYDIYFCHE